MPILIGVEMEINWNWIGVNTY